MSLHKFAEQVAAHGRGDDSLLVHMTPDEVQRLQKFAEANGRTLTINPHTGLPEAGFLSDLFKAVAPIALGAFLGPAGFGLSATMAGVATGGITALATGSLSRGLMAGLGAYGGAGLGESLMTAGGGMSAANAASAAQGQLGAANLALGEAMPAQVADQFTKDAVARMTPSGAVSAGFDKALTSPLEFAKENYKPLLAAAAPIAAGAMVPTTTPLGTPKSDNYIRQFDFNINPETGKPDPLYGIRAMTPVKANEWGNKTFQEQRELFRQQNPNPYELGVASLNQAPQTQQQPARMNTGGIVALADGGFTQDQINAALQAELAARPGTSQADLANYAKSQYGLTDAQINAAYAAQQPAPMTQAAAPAPQAQALQTATTSTTAPAPVVPDASDWWASQPGGVNAMYDYINNQLNTNFKNATDAQIDAAMKQYGISNEDVAAALQKGGGSKAEEYSLLAGNMGLSGLNTNINDWIAKARQDPMFKAKTGLEQQQAALDAMKTVNMNEADVIRATGKTIAELFPSTLTKPISVVPGGTQLPGATVYDNGAFGNYGSGPATGVDYRGNTVSIATPGDIITNPDGTRTVVPNIPGRPYGGFTGIEQLRSRYTAGGGSLGYTAKAPRTIAEFDQLYNKQTGDSLAAYDYLMGKGAGKYPVKSGVSQVSVPYAEYVLGKKTTALKKAGTTATVQGTPGQPQTYFNEAEYLAANPDVAAELKTGKSVSGQPTKFSSGYEHWLMYGKAAGRPFTGDYQGYLTAAALANAPQQGGDAPSGPTGSTGNTISGFTPAPPNDSIPVSDMGIASPGTAASAADGAAAAAASASGTAPGSDGSPGSGAKRGGLMHYAVGGGLGSLGSYSDGGRLLKGPGDGVSDSIPATIGTKQQPARLADGEFVVPARIVSELGNGSTEAGAKKLYAMMDRVQRARGKTTGKNKVAANSRADKYLPA